MVLKPESEIAFTGGSWYGNDYLYKVDHSQDFDSVNGASARFYERWSNVLNAFSTKHGFEVKYILDSGFVRNKIYIRSQGNTNPVYWSVNSNVGSGLTEFFVEVGDVIRGFQNLNDTDITFQFTCFEEMLYRPEFQDYAASIEFDTVTNSIKYVMGSSWEGVYVQQQSSSYLHNYQIPVLDPGDPTYTGYLSFQPDLFDSFDGTWSLRSYSQTIASVVVANDPPENDPPPTPVFVPRSSRRGNLNFW